MSQRRAQLKEPEEAKRLQQIAKKDETLKMRSAFLYKKQEDLYNLKCKKEEQAQAVLRRKEFLLRARQRGGAEDEGKCKKTLQ